MKEEFRQERLRQEVALLQAGHRAAYGVLDDLHPTGLAESSPLANQTSRARSPSPSSVARR